MTENRRRVVVLVVALATLAVSLGWSVAGLRPFGTFAGRYGQIANTVTPHRDAIPEVVTSVTYDMRSFDSLGETFILFSAVMGAALLLRESRDTGNQRPRDAATADTIRLLGLGLVPVVLAVGLWDGVTAGLSPGNGFQVGVILGSGALLIWAAGSYAAFRKATPAWLVDGADGVGAGGIVIIGLIALAVTGVFLQMFGGPGPYATIRSGGIVLYFSWSVALEVAAANVLLFHEFLEEYVPQLPETR
ncbi:MAG: MnhB domain-containing protein [Gaiellaceae bacterium]